MSASNPTHGTGRGRLVAVASGKGGVGKTWLAITLAHALARLGRRVLLFDGDLGLANVDIQLGLLPQHDLGGALRSGADPLSAAAHYGPGGFDILAGRSGAPSLANLPAGDVERIIDALNRATLRHDVVLTDLGAGIDGTVRRMAAAADCLLVVATDEPTSLTDAYAVLKLHAADSAGADRGANLGDRRIVINQAATRSAGERSYTTLARASAAFLGTTPPLAGVVRRDDRVRDAIRRQTLLLTRSPNCHAASDVEAIAATLMEGAAPSRPSSAAPATNAVALNAPA